MLLAGAIFVLTIVLVIWQPKGLGIGWSATLGAVLALVTGVVHPGDIPVVWNIVWNATAAFIAVIIISLLLDESGFFEWAALHVSRWGNGRGRLLFTWIVLLGAAVAALFANDGAALILTPIVIAMLLALGFSKGTTLAFVMAAGFIADTASLPLIVSNLVNIVSADFFGLGFREYASVMVLVDIAAIVATLVMLHLYFRKDIPQNYDMALLKSPAPLADVYKDFSKLETDYMSIVAQCVEDRADDLLKKEQQQNPPKVYRQSVTYAREHGELQQYHASCHLNERCRDEIDAALAQRFDGMRLGAGAVEQVVAEYGLERTKYVLAAAIQTRDGDGRISRINRKWADSIRTIKDMDRRGLDRSCYYADLQAHTCLLDGFVSQVRKFEKAKGQPAQDTPER